MLNFDASLFTCENLDATERRTRHQSIHKRHPPADPSNPSLIYNTYKKSFYYTLSPYKPTCDQVIHTIKIVFLNQLYQTELGHLQKKMCKKSICV